MSILHLRDLGAYGIISDVDPYNIPTNAFSDGLNVRFDDGCVERGVVFRNVDALNTRHATALSGGTAIGDMTAGGGLAASVNGTTSLAAASCAGLASTTVSYIGLTLATAKAIGGIEIYGSNDQGYVNGLTPTVTISLYGATGSAPTTEAGCTLLGTMDDFTDTADESTARTLLNTEDDNTAYDHVLVKIEHDGAAATMYVAELDVFDMIQEPRFATFFVGPTDAEELIVGYKDGSLSRWLVGGDETDVSISGYSPSESDGRFTSTKLGDVLYVNRNDRVPWDWKPGDSQFEALAGGWDSGWRCNILRAYADCLVAFNVTKGANEYPTMVKTSDIATYGAIPTTWDETDLTANATENVLAEMQGDILDAQTLASNMIIYTRYETWMMTADGSDSIFSYRRIFNDAGVINANCSVEIEGKHYVFGYKDIWVHDGVGKESICNSRTRKKIFTNLDFAKDFRCFVHANILLNEIYFCYNDGTASDATFGGVDGCNRAAVYNYKNNTWTFYALPNVFFASDMVLSNPVTYATVTSTYAELSTSYFNVSETGKRAPVMVGDVSATHSLVEKIYGVDLDGEQSVVAFDVDAAATTTWYLEKRGIDLDELNLDLRGYKNIVSIYPQCRMTDDEQSMNFQFSSSDTFGASNAYSDAQSYDNTVYYKLDYKEAGRYVSYYIEGGNLGEKGFRMSGIDFDVEITGER